MSETDLSDEACLEAYQKLKNQLEKERREAFEAGMYSMAYQGYRFSSDHIETAYRAFLQSREGK